MIQSVEAVINKHGKIRLLEPVHIQSNRRALVMILDEEPIITVDYQQNDSPPKPKGMGRHHSGRSDVSQNAEILLRNMIGKYKCR